MKPWLSWSYWKQELSIYFLCSRMEQQLEVLAFDEEVTVTVTDSPLIVNGEAVLFYRLQHDPNHVIVSARNIWARHKRVNEPLDMTMMRVYNAIAFNVKSPTISPSFRAY